MYNPTDTAERIKSVAKNRGIPVRQVLLSTGLSYNAMSNMKTSMPKADNLARIADYLGCSVDYLLGRSEVEKVGGELGEQEKKLIQAYLSADKGTRQAVEKLLDLDK